MAVIAIQGSRKAVNYGLIVYALEHAPAYILDCANCANIHRFFPEYPQAPYDKVFVVELELLYKFRDALKTLVREQPAINTIVITSPNHLFHYGDVAENNELFTHAWELMNELAQRYEVRIAIDNDTQHAFARRFGAHITMGHTIESQRVNLEQIITELERYSKALRPQERERMHKLLKAPLRAVGPISYANSLHAWAFLLLSIILEQEKRLQAIEHVVDRHLPVQEQNSLMAQNE